MPRTNGGTIGSRNLPTSSTTKGIWQIFDLYNSKLVGQWPSAAPTVAVAMTHSGANTSYITAYPWSNSTGFGTKYADPATMISNQTDKSGDTPAFNPPGTVLGMTIYDGSSLSPGVPANQYTTTHAWKFSASGFGTKYSSPAETGTGNGISWHPNNTTVGVSFKPSPYILAYPWSDINGFGTKYSNPATLPTQGNNNDGSIFWTPSGADVGRSGGSSSTKPVEIYPWSDATGFGTKYGDPSSAASGATVDFHWSPAENALAVSSYSSPYIDAYRFTPGSGYGTKYSAPSVSASFMPYGIKYSPSGADLATTGSGLSFGAQVPLIVYPWTYASGFGTKYSNPAFDIGNGYGPSWSPDGSVLFVGSQRNSQSTYDYIYAFPWTSGVGFGTKYSSPTTLPLGYGPTACANLT